MFWILLKTLQEVFSKICGRKSISESFIKNCPSEKSALAEKRSLQEIKAWGILRTPKVIEQKGSQLFIERIYPVAPDEKAYKLLGEQLAETHRKATAARYGFDEDNFCGLNPQINSSHRESWTDFFWENRIRFQIKMAFTKSLISNDEFAWIESLKTRFEQVSNPAVLPSLCHGDLWHGNVLFDHEGPVVIDPAVYYGDRESDLAIAEIFGGFSPSFWRAYRATFPLEEGAEERLRFYKLYHLLNHLSLFGRSYWGSIKALF